MKWMITGGAGYIGGHVTKAMVESGESVVVYDNLASGSAERVQGFAPVETGDIRDIDSVQSVLLRYKVDGIIHLAALKSVEESKIFPEKYEDVNHVGTQVLLNAAKDCDVRAFLFSSSAAVYGNPNVGFVDENSPMAPFSPYGETKLKAEIALNRSIDEGQLRGASLRYFNVAGTASKALADTSKHNLIPVVLDGLTRGERPRIFGTDYPTKDGTCIRDYVHVEDVATAHVVAGKALFVNQLPRCFNIGTGVGYSVKEMIDALLSESKSNLEPLMAHARPGDPASIVANVSLIKEVLSFTASHSLEEIIRSSVEFNPWGDR